MGAVARQFLLPSRSGVGGGFVPPKAMFWIGTTSDDTSVPANWSESDGGPPAAEAPGPLDPVHFTGLGNNPATLPSDTSWGGSLDVIPAYTAKIDLGVSDLVMANGGDVTLAGGGEFDMGSGTLSLTNGDFDNSGQTTFTRGTSTLSMAGVGTITSTTAVSHYLGILTIESDAVISASNMLVNGDMNINGTLNITANGSALSYINDISIGANGILTGDGLFTVHIPGDGHGITSFAVGGVIDVAELRIRQPIATSIMAVGTYSSAMTTIFKTTGESVLTLSATPTNPYIFVGNLQFYSSGINGLTIANNTNSPDITLQGDVIWIEAAGTVTYTKGTGTLTASGASTQDWDFGGSAIEDVTVNKSAGTLTFSESCDPDSITQTAGEIRIADTKTLTVFGNCVFNDDLTGITNPVILNVVGSNVAHNATITNINCTGTPLDATDNCIDGGGNTGVNFV